MNPNPNPPKVGLDQNIKTLKPGDVIAFKVTRYWYPKKGEYFLCGDDVVQSDFNRSNSFPILTRIPSCDVVTEEMKELIGQLISKTRGWRYLGDCDKWTGQVKTVEDACLRVESILNPPVAPKVKTVRERYTEARSLRVNADRTLPADLVLADELDRQAAEIALIREKVKP